MQKRLKLTAPACVRLRKRLIMNDRLSYKEKKQLPDEVFGLPGLREYPMPDAAHVRAAEAYFRYCPEQFRPAGVTFQVDQRVAVIPLVLHALRPELARAILERARMFGVDVESPVILSYAEK